MNIDTSISIFYVTVEVSNMTLGPLGNYDPSPLILKGDVCVAVGLI